MWPFKLLFKNSKQFPLSSHPSFHDYLDVEHAGHAGPCGVHLFQRQPRAACPRRPRDHHGACRQRGCSRQPTAAAGKGRLRSCPEGRDGKPGRRRGHSLRREPAQPAVRTRDRGLARGRPIHPCAGHAHARPAFHGYGAGSARLSAGGSQRHRCISRRRHPQGGALHHQPPSLHRGGTCGGAAHQSAPAQSVGLSVSGPAARQHPPGGRQPRAADREARRHGPVQPAGGLRPSPGRPRRRPGHGREARGLRQGPSRAPVRDRRHPGPAETPVHHAGRARPALPHQHGGPVASFHPHSW